MIFPSKEVYLEDIQKELSFPGDMHDDDIKFQVDVNEYGKSPRQSIMEILAKSEPIISDEQWFEMEKQAKDTMKAVPEFLKGVGQSMAQDVEDVGRALTFQSPDLEGQAAARKAVVDPGLKLANSMFETFVGRIYEPVRAFVGDAVTGKMNQAVPDMIRGAVMPSTVEKISSPERIPFTEKELSGGVGALIPRAIAMGIEDVMLYGSKIQDIPKMLDAYQVNAVRNVLRESTAKIHTKVMDATGMSADDAWQYMSRPEVQSHLYYMAEKSMKKPKLYSGVPAVPDPNAAAKAVGDAAAKTAAQGAGKATVGAAIKAAKDRGFVGSIQDEMPQLKVSGQYIPRSTDELSIKARNLIKDDIVLAENKAATGLDDESIAIGAELLKHYTEAASKVTDKTISDALYDKAAELGNSMAERLTNLGRSVQAASILARQTPEGQIRFAAQSIKKYNEELLKSPNYFKKPIPELSGDQARVIRDQMDSIVKMPDGEQKAIAWKELQDYISDLVPTPLYRKISTIWKAGLLTGFKTHELNMFSNLIHSGTEILKDIPAVGVDSVAALFTGKKSVALTVKGLAGGGKEGFQRGVQFFKTGYDARDVLSKLDYRRVNFGKGKVARALHAYEQTIFRMLGAEDQIFYYGAKARSIAEQAIVQAKNKGLKGKAAETFIDDLIQNPTDEMVTYAVADAETAVFQKMTPFHEVGKAIQKLPGGEFILPFSKTPSAVAWQIMNYSPVGVANTLWESLKSGKFDQREFSKGMGRVLFGIPILWMGYQLYQDGNMNLDKPKSEKEKKLWEAEGRKANTVRVGGKWRTIQSLGPAGNLLLVGGQFAKNFDGSGSPTEAITKAGFGSLKSFTEQTFLKGVNSAVEALNDPQKQGEYFFTGLVSSAIPTIVSDVARATDDKERRNESIADAVANRIPIIRKNVQEQVDFLGRDRIIKENFFETMFDFTRPMTEIKDPIVQEIRRLTDEGHDISTTMLGDREGYKILTPEQNTEIWQRSGGIAFDKISSYMQMDSYDDTPDDVKAKNIDKIIDKAKVIARTEKVLEITVGLEGDELMAKLSEAKKDGLLNREVLEQYKRMR